MQGRNLQCNLDCSTQFLAISFDDCYWFDFGINRVGEKRDWSWLVYWSNYRVGRCRNEEKRRCGALVAMRLSKEIGCPNAFDYRLTNSFIYSNFDSLPKAFNYNEVLKHRESLLLLMIYFDKNYFTDSSQLLTHVLPFSLGLFNSLTTLADLQVQLTGTTARECNSNMKQIILQTNKCVKFDPILSFQIHSTGSCSNPGQSPFVFVFDSSDCYGQIGSYGLKDYSQNHCYEVYTAVASAGLICGYNGSSEQTLEFAVSEL